MTIVGEEEEKVKQRTKWNAILGLTIFVLSGLYISLVFNRNIWTDEAFTMQLVSDNSFWGIIQGTMIDVHPPFYYLLTKVFVLLFGDAIIIYKLVSVIPMIITMVMGIVWIRRWFGEWCAFLFLLFLNGIPCVMEYGVQIRMYSWTICFLTAIVLCVYRRNYVFLTILAILACYTHNFAMLSTFFIYTSVLLYDLIKKNNNWKKVFVSGLVVSISYVPWLIILYKQTTERVGNYWIEPVDIHTIIGYFSDLFGSSLPLMTEMFCLICVLAIINMIRLRKQEDCFGLFLLFIPVLTAIIGIIVSVVVTPFFIARYLIPCMGILALALAIGYSKESETIKIILSVFLIISIIFSYVVNYEKEYTSTKTEEFLTYMEENMDETDLIAYNYQIQGFIYRRYFEPDKVIYLDDIDWEQNDSKVWFLDSCKDTWLRQDTIAQHGLQMKFIGRMGIEQNEFNLYSITK